MTEDLQQQAAPPETPEAPPPPSPSGDTQPSPVDAGPSQTEWTGIRDYAKSLGVPLDHYQDDHQAFRDILTAYRTMPQYQQLARYGQEYLQHQDQFQKWLAQQQPGGRQEQQQPQQSKGWWNPPADYGEVRRLVDQWFVEDPQTGQPRPRPDCPPSVIQKVSDYANYQRDWQQKLFHNPQEALRNVFQDEAKRMFTEQMQNQQAIGATQQIMARNADWLYYKDQGGTPMTGQYTPRGLQYLDYVQKLEASGVRDPRMVDWLAMSLLQRDIYQETQQPQQQPQQAQPGQRTATVREPQRQSQPSGQGGLAAMLAQELAANGNPRFATSAN